MINVLYPFDNNYAQYAGVSITSVLESNKHSDSINVYVIGFGLDDQNKTRFKELVRAYGRNIIFLDETLVEKKIDELALPSYRGASVAAARLFVSYYMDEFEANHTDRIIYLDSDTIVIGDLEDMMQEELDGHPVGLVIDSVGRDAKQNIGFDFGEPYYNAGVILYDLKRWNQKECTENIINHVKNVRKNYEALDQDLLNIVLKGDVQTLSPRYNMQPFHRRFKHEDYCCVYQSEGYYTIKELVFASENTCIVHAFRFLNTFAWHINSLHPDKQLFETYKEISPWAEEPEAEADISGATKVIQRFIYEWFPAKIYLFFFRRAFKRSSFMTNKRLLSDNGYQNI